MPVNGSGTMFYAAATKSTVHGAPCIENGVVGVAVKQKAPSWREGYGVNLRTIAIAERFAIISKGRVEIPTAAGFAKGDMLYIEPATNAVGEADTATSVPFGRIVEVAGERGTPTGKVRVDLDHKDVAANV